MAPRGGSRGAQGGRAPIGQPGRETKSATLNSKPISRGGISKRKGRTDTDGDLDMTATTRRSTRNTAGGSSRGGKSTSTRSASKVAEAVQRHLKTGDGELDARISQSSDRKKSRPAPNLTWLRVRGLKESKASRNPDGGLSDLLAFLERKAGSFTSGRRKRAIKVKKSRVAGDFVFIASSPEDAEEFLKLNTFQFASAPLEVVEADSLENPNKATESPETQQLREKLQLILGQRYLAPNKLLKLDSLATDPELVALGMFENRDRALKTFKGLMAICDSRFQSSKEKREAIESISVASNNIDDVIQVESLATTFPQLKNLDISGNQIAKIEGLQRWKGKLRELETVYLSGNPIEAADSTLQSTLLQWFPNLQIINGVQVRTGEEVAAAKAAAGPKPIPQSGPDFRDVNGIGENFLLEFFTAYDGDRPGLASRLYDEGSQFSLAVDTHSVRDPSAPAPLPWKSYIPFSRNLSKITTQNARFQRLFKGTNVIHELWAKLPPTRHPSIKDEMSKYIMDCHPLQGLVDPTGQNPLGVDGLILTVHGEFDEYDAPSDSMGKRSFSRTFLLGPGMPGKSTIRVVSDMLSLRAFNPLPNVHGTDSQPVAPPQAPNQAMLEELCKRTGMTPEYSEMCLSQVGWDFDKALVMFEEKKTQLPPEAFAAAPA
ncbi:hypothetical protein CC79DRAFT_1362355 [Sarocladium strictum]